MWTQIYGRDDDLIVGVERTEDKGVNISPEDTFNLPFLLPSMDVIPSRVYLQPVNRFSKNG